MIRLIIPVVFLFLIWVLFISSFNKRRKIIIALIAVSLCGLGIWLDGHGKKSKTGIINNTELSVCGTTAQHSYRTNFDVNLCLENKAEKGTVQRIRLQVSAEKCTATDNCDLINKVERDVRLILAPGQKKNVVENMDFKGVQANDPDVQWRTTILSIKATP